MSEPVSPTAEVVLDPLHADSSTVEPQTYLFNQKKYESIADVHTAVVLSRSSSRAQWWRCTTVTVKRNDSDEVISVTLSCAACAKTISLGNPSKFWTSHRAHCQQKSKDVTGELIDSKGKTL
jgi:hypothetical protein